MNHYCRDRLLACDDAIQRTPMSASSHIRDACSAVLELVTAREQLSPISHATLEGWQYASDEELEALQTFEVQTTFRVRLETAFMHAERAASEGHESESLEALSIALISLVDGFWWVSKDNDTPGGAQNATKVAIAALLQFMRHPRRRIYLPRTADLQVDDTDRDQIVDAIGITWSQFDQLRKRMRTGMLVRGQEVIDLAQPDLSTSADAVLAGPTDHVAVQRPDYDRSDATRRVRTVLLSNFRGAPTQLSVDFTKHDKPVSALIVGDNGVGKSTIVDAIEFGLQGRVGRSISFDSPLRPAAASFAAEGECEVVVTLDDTSRVTRTLTKGDSGRLVPTSDDVRPGFRLAPVTLKREDILRFLDTDALARGHVFFDYFPATVDAMAIRPEEVSSRLEDEEYQLRVQRTRLAEILAEALAVDPSVTSNRDRLLRVLRERFTNGESIEKARRSGAWDRVDASVRTPVELQLSVTQRLAAIKRQRKQATEILNPVPYRQQTALLAEVLSGVGDRISEAFREISGATYVERFHVVFGRSGPVALDLVVELSSGLRCFPQALFSEGYKDLLAILFFAAVAKSASEHGQAKILILDDVFQSVDATVRTGTVRYLLREFRDWQLIFTVHDRLWYEQLRNAFSRAQHSYVELELRRWTFDGGPVLIAEPSELTSSLKQQIVEGDPGLICGVAGRLLEQACDHLSWRIGSSVVRRPGDKYTLGDLWPGVAKALRTTSLAQTCAKVDELYELRNLAGAHYNQWAESLTVTEAERFGEAVVDFVTATWCPDCHDWVGRQGRAVACRAGHLSLTPPPVEQADGAPVAAQSE